MPQRTFTTEELEENYGLPYERIASWIVSEHRWYTRRTAVFQADDGKHWQVEYLDPATEMQEDIDPWDDNDEVIARQVREVEVVVNRWEKI